MTISRTTATIAAPDVGAAVAAVRAGGLRISAARRLVIEALFEASGPVSAEDIAGGLDGRVHESDLASVYRNLETLEELGLVRHVHLGHGPGLYALTDRADREYLVCSRCDAFSTVSRDRLEKVRAAILDATGFEAGFTHFPIVGLCPDCSKRSGTDGLRS